MNIFKHIRKFISKFKLCGYVSIYRFWQQKPHNAENIS